MNRIKSSLLACLTTLALPAQASEPTFTCNDVAKVGRDLYARTKEAHDLNYRRYAEFLAEGFWRVAEGFSACGGDLEKMKREIANHYPSTTRGRLRSDGSFFGTTVSGTSDRVQFNDLTVEVADRGGTAVVGGKVVPGKMFVDGIPFVPAGSATAAAKVSDTGKATRAAAAAKAEKGK